MYKIDSFISRGGMHLLHCEDDFYVYEDEEVIVAAVFDGCSSGIDSQHCVCFQIPVWY